MVTKSKKQSGAKGKVKVLTINKESVNILTNEEKRKVKGGVIALSQFGSCGVVGRGSGQSV